MRKILLGWIVHAFPLSVMREGGSQYNILFACLIREGCERACKNFITAAYIHASSSRLSPASRAQREAPRNSERYPPFFPQFFLRPAEERVRTETGVKRVTNKAKGRVFLSLFAHCSVDVGNAVYMNGCHSFALKRN